jgi:hypothetical protein
MPQPQQKEPRPEPDGVNEINVNIGSVFVGILLFMCLIWSLWIGEMLFAYLNVSLLTLLAIANYAIRV